MRVLTLEEAHTGWKSFRHHLDQAESVEVFVSPNGHWYKRAGKGDRPDLIAPMRTQGAPVMHLVCIDHWKPAEEPTVSKA